VEAIGRIEREASCLVLAGHCYEQTTTPRYGPWRALVGAEGTGDGVTPPVALTGLSDALPATSQADPYSQARDFFSALAVARPVVIVLEDVHWADTASLDLLRALVRVALPACERGQCRVAFVL
jgi:hypothetical protein